MVAIASVSAPRPLSSPRGVQGQGSPRSSLALGVACKLTVTWMRESLVLSPYPSVPLDGKFQSAYRDRNLEHFIDGAGGIRDLAHKLT